MSLLMVVRCHLLTLGVVMVQERGQDGQNVLLQIIGRSLLKHFAQLVVGIILPDVPYSSFLFLQNACIGRDESLTSGADITCIYPAVVRHILTQESKG